MAGPLNPLKGPSRLRSWISASPLRLYALFVLLPLLPVLLFTYFNDRALTSQEREQVISQNEQIADLSTILVAEHFNQVMDSLRMQAAQPDLIALWKKKDLVAIQTLMEQAHPRLKGATLISIYDLDGTMRGIAPLDPAVIGQNFSHRDWYKGVAESWKPYVSEVYRPAATPNELSVAAAVPVLDEDGKPIGIIAAAYSLRHISNWLTQAMGSGTRVIGIVDQRGQLLAKPGIDVYAKPVDLSRHPAIALALQGRGSSGEFPSALFAGDSFTSYRYIDVLGWAVLVEKPVAEVNAGIWEVRRQAAVFSTIFIALALVSGMIVATLYRTQQRLTHQVLDLSDSEARYRSLIEGATYGIYRSDDRGFLTVNRAMVEMLGYQTEAEVVALDLSRDLYVNPADRNRLIEEYRRTAIVTTEEVLWKKKDGTRITVQISGRTVPGTNGSVCFEMIAEDITERRALEAQLRQSQKMEAIGRLAGGVAHDFNNLLTVISGYNEMTMDALGADHPATKELEEIRKATERAAGLTRQLLAFSRQQVLEPRVIDLNTVVAGMENLLRRLIGEDIESTIRLARGLGSIKADPGQIGQVILNLAVNARDAMADTRGGRLSVETANILLDEQYAREHLAIPAGSYVMLAVSDTGAGMSEEIRSHIFEPFFTTKAQGRGTGLGLSTVYGIIKQSGGFIWVYSEVGMGTTFKIYMPRVDQEADSLPSTPRRKQLQGTETILIVEDEDGVRSLTTSVLRRAGYQVMEASGGEIALRLVEKAQGKVDLLLTDVVLNQMSGRELAESIQRQIPTLRVLYMSGYTDDAILQRGVLAADTFFLQKPFTTDGLVRKVREVLDATPV